jgi:hypothetical protein
MNKKLVLIEWADSYGVSPSWEEITLPMTPKSLTCTSVGWLAHDGEDVKVIVPHWHDEDQDVGAALSGCGDMTIPTSAIRRMVQLHSHAQSPESTKSTPRKG